MLLVASGVDQDNAMLHSRPILRAIAFALTLAPQLSGAADNVSPPAIQEVVWVVSPESQVCVAEPGEQQTMTNEPAYSRGHAFECKPGQRQRRR